MARIIFNEEVRVPEDIPSRAPLEYHQRLPGYTVTPLVQTDHIAQSLDLARVWIKDESKRLALPSFKILGASWATYRALEEHIDGFDDWHEIDDLRRQLKPHLPLALAAATDGNHGRAVARMAKLLGLAARIFVPTGTASARIQAIQSEGATCTVVDGTYDDAVARSAEEASTNCLVISDTSWEGYKKVPGWVIEGYSTIFWEIEDQLAGDSPDVVIIQVGVGALGAAAVRHFRAPGKPRTHLVAVEPETAACVLASAEVGKIVTVPGPHDSIMAGLNCGTPSLIAWPYISKGFDCYLAIEDARTGQAMRMLADSGITSGEAGAAGLGGLIVLIKAAAQRIPKHLDLDATTRVLLISTEGATNPQIYGRIVRQAPAKPPHRNDLD